MGKHPNLIEPKNRGQRPRALRDSRRRPSCDVLWASSSGRGQSGIGSLPAPSVVQRHFSNCNATESQYRNSRAKCQNIGSNSRNLRHAGCLSHRHVILPSATARRARLIQITRISNNMPRNYITWMRDEWDGDLGGFRYQHERDACYLGKGDGPYWRLVRSRKPYAIPRSRLKHDAAPATAQRNPR
jgi:hypothetical protein